MELETQLIIVGSVIAAIEAILAFLTLFFEQKKEHDRKLRVQLKHEKIALYKEKLSSNPSKTETEGDASSLQHSFVPDEAS